MIMTEENTIIFGIRAVQEALQTAQTIDKIYLQIGLQGVNYQELERQIKKSGTVVSRVPLEKLNQLAKFQNHQGVVARIAPMAYVDLEVMVESVMNNHSNPIFLLLDQITDVRNFGAMVRTAACTGVHGIIVPKNGSASLSGAGIKTSAGGVFKVPICKVDHLKDAVYYLQSVGVMIVAVTEKTEELLYDIDFRLGVALIMGSEDKGIQPSLLKIADVKGKLPISKDMDSLNVSVACGAALYEIVRQRTYNK